MQEDKKEPVTLSDNTMDTFGFARFYYPGEPVIRENIWTREIITALNGTNSRTIQQIHIPDSMLIPLSRESSNKLTRNDAFTVETSGNDITPMLMLRARAGWNQTEQDIKELVALDPEGNFTAFISIDNIKIPLGTGAALPVGRDVSWIGMVLIHPEVRRQGIAQAIMNRCVEYALLKRNYLVNGLDATPMGLQVYQSLGYKESFRLWACTIKTGDVITSSSVKYIEPVTDAEEFCMYEREKGITDRHEILKLHHRRYPQGCFMAKVGGKTVGYVLSRPRRIAPSIGPLLSDSPEIASELLKAVVRHWLDSGYTELSIFTPECHFNSVGNSDTLIDLNANYEFPHSHVLSEKIKPVRPLSRMYIMIDKNELSELIEMQVSRGIMGKEIVSLKNMFHQAVQNYKKTQKYIENEKQNILPLLYAISGPELG